MIEAEMSVTDKWWSSITTAQKEHIAKKVLVKMEKERGVTEPEIDPQEYAYPRCSELWLKHLSEKQKAWIKAHCEEGHGFWENEEKEGRMFSE